MIRSQSWSVVKCSEVENWIELFSGCSSEEPFKGFLQHHKVFYSAALRKASICPQGCLVTANTPELTSGELNFKKGLQLAEESSYPLDRTAKYIALIWQCRGRTLVDEHCIHAGYCMII